MLSLSIITGALVRIPQCLWGQGQKGQSWTWEHMGTNCNKHGSSAGLEVRLLNIWQEQFSIFKRLSWRGYNRAAAPPVIKKTNLDLSVFPYHLCPMSQREQLQTNYSLFRRFKESFRPGLGHVMSLQLLFEQFLNHKLSTADLGAISDCCQKQLFPLTNVGWGKNLSALQRLWLAELFMFLWCCDDHTVPVFSTSYLSSSGLKIQKEEKYHPTNSVCGSWEAAGAVQGLSCTAISWIYKANEARRAISCH